MTPNGNGPELGQLRRMQLVSTYGPGAVVDYLAQGGAVSGVTLGLDDWKKNECRHIVEPALQRLLGVRDLYEPPVSLSKRGRGRIPALPASRFPEWLECPKCHEVRHYSGWKRKDKGSAVHTCTKEKCKEGTNSQGIPVVPARFMIVCESGHLSDFPWMEWVSHKEECEKRGRLRLESKGAGLRNLFLRCTDCGNRESMRDAVNNITRVLEKCPGNRPWLGKDATETDCDAHPTTALRGSANIYFPQVVSVLTIPPWTDEFRAVLAKGGFWQDLMNARDNLREDCDEAFYEKTLNLIVRRMAEYLDCEESDARKQVDAFLRAYDGLPDKEDPNAQESLRREEWRQFRSGSNRKNDQTFEARDEEVPERIRTWFDAFVRVPRLREVRALRGFSRRYPPDGTDPKKIAQLSLKADWRPVMENLGEGIFIALNEKQVADWEKDKNIKARAADFNDKWVKYWRERYKRDDDPPTQISPRRLLVHSMSHALMIELSVSCGYSAASLHERLYLAEADSNQPMAGFLIYTASSDAEGTLGGLEREGLPDRLTAKIESAVARMKWCSSDPLCRAGVSTATDELNGAACHSCLFVSETACELFNRSLDRVMMIGNESIQGYFQDAADSFSFSR